MGRRMGVNYLVAGSVTRLDGTFVVNARLVSTATGEIVPGTSTFRYCPREADLYPAMQSISRFMSYQIGGYNERIRIARERREQGEQEVMRVAGGF